MVDNGFNYAMDKWSEQQRKLMAKRAQRIMKLREILQKYDKSLDVIRKEEMSKRDHDYVIDVVTNDFGYPLRIYPNLAGGERQAEMFDYKKRLGLV